MPEFGDTGSLGDALATATLDVREVNTRNGWFDGNRSVLEGHMLIVTEVAEASEAWRRWGTDDVTGCPSGDTNCTVDWYHGGKKL